MREDRNTLLRKPVNTPGRTKAPRREERPRARLDWDDIRIFLAVAEAGSIHGAAGALKLVPSSVSRRIEDLEARLDATLFNRSKSGMSLTAAGDDLRDRGRSMQRLADDIERSVRSRDRKEQGQVLVAAPDGVGSLWVGPQVGDFLARNPKIQLVLDCQLGPAKREAGPPDITLALDKSIAEIGDDASELATLHYVFAASPAYLATYGTPKSMGSAAGDHRSLRQTGQVSQRESWGKRASAIEALADFQFESNSSAAVALALQAGAGIATVPSYLFALSPDLVVVGQEQSVAITLWLVVHAHARNAERVKRAVEWLRSVFDTKKNPWFRSEFVPPEEFQDELDVAQRLPRRGK